jgi:Icc-related predicted phosphoesterase
MRIVVLSDTHGMHDRVKVPDGDVLIHCGDLTDAAGQAALRSFLFWMEALPHKHKVFIAGNHDWAFEKWPDLARLMVKELSPNSHYLQDSGCEIDGVKFWGSPYQPEFFNWAFNLPRGEALRRHWDMIPNDTDVLITHGPPFSILDVSGFDKVKCGCRDLYEAILRVKPSLHCFGHIHHSYGSHRYFHDDGWLTTCINASICNEAYKPIRSPFIYEMATSPKAV